MGVIEDLKELGGKQVGDKFNQDSFRTHNVLDSVNLTSGYCAGVVLDWARRVLQSAPERDEKYMSYSTPKLTTERKVATLRRMAQAYDGQATSYVSETKKGATVTELRKLKLLQVESWTDYGTGVPVPSNVAEMLGKYWDIPGKPNSTFAKFDLNSEPAGVLTYQDIDRLIANLSERQDAQHKPGSADGRHWETFAAELDTKFRKHRDDATQKAPTKLFGNLEVVKSSPSQDYPEAGYWFAELRTQGLQLNCCTTASFKPTGGGNGHQIAIHQTGMDEFVFFDPNYGAFRFAMAGLKACFQHLFWKAIIVDDKVLDGAKAVYLRRKVDTAKDVGSWNRLGYTIFQRKEEDV